MSRSAFGAATMVAILSGLAAPQAGATELCGCRLHTHHHHVAVRTAHPRIAYGRPLYAVPPRVVYNHEDNGQYDGADVPPPYGQPQSWLDGYGTRPVTFHGYTYNAYGNSAQTMPFGIAPAGGLAVYSAGAYGPGPRIIEVPGY